MCECVCVGVGACVLVCLWLSVHVNARVLERKLTLESCCSAMYIYTSLRPSNELSD